MTDHARAALEGYAPVFDAREQWLASDSAADKATFLAAAAEYRSRFDCSCATDTRICDCVYTPDPAAVTSDASDTTNFYRSDSGVPTMPKSYSDFLKQTNGDTHEATRRFHAATHNSRRPTAASSVRSDAADAEAEMKKHNRALYFTPFAASNVNTKELQRQQAAQADRTARSDAADAERKQHRANALRMDTGSGDEPKDAA